MWSMFQGVLKIFWCYLRFSYKNNQEHLFPLTHLSSCDFPHKGFYLTNHQLLEMEAAWSDIFERPIKCSKSWAMAAEFGLSDVMDEVQKNSGGGSPDVGPRTWLFPLNAFLKNLIHEARLILSNTNIWNKNHHQYWVEETSFLAKWPFYLVCDRRGKKS